MSKLTCIYVLFKEYVDGSTAASAPYINGEEYPLGQGGVLNEELRGVLDVLVFPISLLFFYLLENQEVQKWVPIFPQHFHNNFNFCES